MFIKEHSMIKAEVVADSFSRAALGYDGEPLRFLRSSAEFLVDSLTVKSPQKILDVATGTGRAAILSAQAIWPDGLVTAVDISEGMLQQAKQNAAQAGVKNLQFTQANAEQLGFEFKNDYFDVVLCSSGIYIMRNIPQSISEWKRVVKPGGRVAFSTFGTGVLEPMMSRFETALRAYGVEIISPTPLYRLNTAENCKALLNHAGLKNIKILTKQSDYYLPSAKDWITLVKNSGFRFPLERLNKKYLNQFIEEHQTAISQLVTDKGIYLKVPIIVAIGEKS
jgi:ubiquinone/menaquinone biosynthesis C-methylase UbiE